MSSRLRAVSLTPPGEGDKNGGDEEEVIETKKLIVTTLGGAKEVERETCVQICVLNLDPKNQC